MYKYFTKYADVSAARTETLRLILGITLTLLKILLVFAEACISSLGLKSVSVD